ncbi:ATP-binding protein [Thioalkalivibrio sp.]|uniref:ATP-binding protein n=1 Tax=Thioalkalivibrio sp. TaxID=2093813 RepID=UPI0039752AB4
MLLLEAIANTSDSVAQLFEELYDPALLIDADNGDIIGANTAACLFLGYSAEEFAGLSPADIHPHEIPRLEAFLFAIQSHGRWVADDLSCRAKNGALIPAQVRATRVHIGGRTYILSIVHDRRDAELAELGRSIRKLTHDLRNTMVSSRLMSDRLRRHEDPLVRQSAEVIARSVDRAVRMCQRTLEVGSAAEGKPRRERFMLADVISELHAALGPEEVTGARLDATGAAAVELDADFDQVFRILMNLVRNALAAGATRIEIDGTADAASTIIDIRDNGPGLPVSVRSFLFAEKTGATPGGGAGLGLAIAWELARNHQGDLTLLATGPEGTAFRLALPSVGATPDELIVDGPT